MAENKQNPARPPTKKLARVLRQVFCEPWLIREDMHRQIQEIVARHYEGKENRDLIEQMFPPQEPPTVEMSDSIAIIPIEGVIGKGVSAIERSSGVVDIADIDAMLDWSVNDRDVDGILLDIDSPGGTVSGVPELAEKIYQANKIKPIFAYTDEMAASAAYWLGSQARAFYAAQSATVGSVGVYLSLLDTSRAYEHAGLKREIIKAGKFKGAGIDGTSLTDEQRASLQQSVNYIHAIFQASVRRQRKEVSDESMQGQEFMSELAKEVKMIDGLASRAETIRMLSQYAKQNK